MSGHRYEVFIYESAERDLQEIFHFIRNNDGNNRAISVVSKLEEAVNSLRHMPGRCQVAEFEVDVEGSCRKLTADPYQILFRIHGLNVYVYAIFDVRRNYSDLLRDRLSRDATG